MRRIFIPIALFLLTFQLAKGCDACGSSGGMNGIGLFPNLFYNNVGIRWFHSPFQSTEAGFGSSKDDFYTIEIFARYQVNERLKFNLQQPIRWNKRVEGDGTGRSLSGISDTRLSAVYAILNSKPLSDNITIYWEAGMGVKFPTGKYQQNLVREDNLPDNFNIGMGNWAWLLQSNWTMTYQSIGWNNSINYQKNGASTDGYQFGDVLNLSSSFFLQISNGKRWQLTPFLGISSEFIADDTFTNGNSAHSTGGEGYFLNCGIGFQYNKWQVRSSLANPITQSYADNEVEAKRRLSVDVTFIF